MYDPVEDGIGQRFLSDYFVPLLYRYLRGNNGAAFSVPVLDDVQ
jgi:hypothetical protein